MSKDVTVTLDAGMLLYMRTLLYTQYLQSIDTSVIDDEVVKKDIELDMYKCRDIVAYMPQEIFEKVIDTFDKIGKVALPVFEEELPSE